MAEENKNMQSIANESEKRADVEKTGLLDEDEHDDWLIDHTGKIYIDSS